MFPRYLSARIFPPAAAAAAAPASDLMSTYQIIVKCFMLTGAVTLTARHYNTYLHISTHYCWLGPSPRQLTIKTHIYTLLATIFLLFIFFCRMLSLMYLFSTSNWCLFESLWPTRYTFTYLLQYCGMKTSCVSLPAIVCIVVTIVPVLGAAEQPSRAWNESPHEGS